jgi:hypothetical protein
MIQDHANATVTSSVLSETFPVMYKEPSQSDSIPMQSSTKTVVLKAIKQTKTLTHKITPKDK